MHPFSLFQVLTYEDRRELATHPLSKSLFDIMISKKTNLAFSVDVTSSSQLLEVHYNVKI